VARSSEIGEEPIRALLLGKPWVLWRGPEGLIAAFEDRCPHRRAPLSMGKVVDGSLRCGYHGWRFDAVGDCTEIPGLGEAAVIPSRTSATRPFGVVESHGMVFLAPKAPLVPLPAMPEADDPSFKQGDLPVIVTRGSAGLLADNFLDMAHFPFVHAGTFGADEARCVEPYEVAREGYSSSVVITHAFANREDQGVEAGIRPLLQQRRLTYRYTAPFHLALRIDFLEAGGTNTIGYFLCPEDAETTRIYSTLWRDDLDGDEASMRDAVDFEVAVVEEDLRLQAHFDLLALPLGLTEEAHTRVDKSTIELRRILQSLVEAAAP
jgi:vanillate O-demethylase monooxygenase subunit